jgi:hypothetical protein
MLLAAGVKNENGEETVCISFLDDSIPEGSIIR